MKFWLVRKNSRLCTTAGLALLLFLNGCSQIHREIGQDFYSQAAELIQSEQEIDVARVLEVLGPPQKMSALPQGYAFLYQFSTVDEQQIGLSSDRPVLRLFKFSMAEAEARIKMAVFRFDCHDQLVAATSAINQSDLGDEQSIMFALAVSALVDSDDLGYDRWSPNLWGASLLQSTAKTVNAQSGLDSGNIGFEQRGTPTGVGQRTLELHP
jgi:hypothetical protein